MSYSDCGKNLPKPRCAETATRAIAFEAAQECEQAFADQVQVLCTQLSGVHIAGETAGNTPDAVSQAPTKFGSTVAERLRHGRGKRPAIFA